MNKTNKVRRSYRDINYSKFKSHTQRATMPRTGGNSNTWCLLRPYQMNTPTTLYRITLRIIENKNNLLLNEVLLKPAPTNNARELGQIINVNFRNATSIACPWLDMVLNHHHTALNRKGPTTPPNANRNINDCKLIDSSINKFKL